MSMCNDLNSKTILNRFISGRPHFYSQRGDLTWPQLLKMQTIGIEDLDRGSCPKGDAKKRNDPPKKRVKASSHHIFISNVDSYDNICQLYLCISFHCSNSTTCFLQKLMNVFCPFQWVEPNFIVSYMQEICSK